LYFLPTLPERRATMRRFNIFMVVSSYPMDKSNHYK
jgi:hypothetical protein